jgi:hypothetical protein
VVHPHRFSHLRKFVFLPDRNNTKTFTGLSTPNPRQQLEELPGIKSVHPYAALAVVAGLFPPDLALDSSDCWKLFKIIEAAAVRCKRNAIIREVKELQPEIFFKSTPFLRNVDIIRYEEALRRTMEKWIAEPSRKEVLAHVTSALGGSINRQVSIMEASHSDASPYAREGFQTSLLALLSELNLADKLPALVFNFDRNGVECMAQELASALISAESEWKTSNAEWKTKVETWRKWESGSKARQKREDQQMKSLKGKALEEQAREKEGSWLDTFDPQRPLPQFSFQSPRSKVASQEMEDDISSLTRWNDIPEWMLDCLRRGIGIHHSGLNRRFRQLVETLFRAGTLRVVIATGTLCPSLMAGTLALGINMPCRTVVFAGDSVFVHLFIPNLM